MKIERTLRLKMGLAILVSFIASLSLSAGGMGISPTSFTLQSMPVGKNVDLGVDLIVFNNDDKEETYEIKAIKPMEKKAAKLGYEVIPDPSWVHFPKNTLTVKPKSQGKVRMHLSIPKGDQYYNRHWLVEVMAVPATPHLTKGTKTSVVMAISGIYMIETKSKSPVKTIPTGKLAIVPSIVSINGFTPGKKQHGKFTIYNNDKESHSYTVTTDIFPKKPKIQISAFPGFKWVESPEWVKLPKDKITVEPGKSADVIVEAVVPMGKQAGDEGWEAILMVTPDKGDKQFARLHLEAKKK